MQLNTCLSFFIEAHLMVPSMLKKSSSPTRTLGRMRLVKGILGDIEVLHAALR